MLTIQELVIYLDKLLQPELFKDYCPNGLQIAGNRHIQHIVCGVTANQALIESAVTRGADTLLVHHGFFWKGEDPCLTGIKKNRIAALVKHNINLLAYHLPLDAHSLYGNNVQLAQRLGLSLDGIVPTEHQPPLVVQGTFAKPLTVTELSALLTSSLDRKPLHVGAGSPLIQRVALCTGGAQDFIDEVAKLTTIDAYISGEISERTTHSAIEQNIHYFAAGHHATERYGVQALGSHLAEKFELKVEFVEIDNPV